MRLAWQQWTSSEIGKWKRSVVQSLWCFRGVFFFVFFFVGWTPIGGSRPCQEWRGQRGRGEDFDHGPARMAGVWCTSAMLGHPSAFDLKLNSAWTLLYAGSAPSRAFLFASGGIDMDISGTPCREYSACGNRLGCFGRKFSISLEQRLQMSAWRLLRVFVDRKIIVNVGNTPIYRFIVDIDDNIYGWYKTAGRSDVSDGKITTELWWSYWSTDCF